MRKLAFTAIFLVTAFHFACADAFAFVKVEGRYWFTDLNDTVKVSKGGLSGTEINLKDDLGVGARENFWEGRATLEVGRHKVRYGFTPLKWDGSKTISRAIVFNGNTYPAAANVDSSFKAYYHRLSYEYDIIKALQNSVGVIMEVKYFDSKARVDAPALGINESKSFKLPIPAVGVSAQAGLPYLMSIGGEVTGMALGKDIYIVDAEAGINFKPAPFVTVSCGYRFFKVHVENDDDKGDVMLKGPFAMLRAEF